MGGTGESDGKPREDRPQGAGFISDGRFSDGMIEVIGWIKVVIIAERRHHDCGSFNVGLVRRY